MDQFANESQHVVLPFGEGMVQTFPLFCFFQARKQFISMIFG
jgi:hypothetical protein